MNVKSFLSKLLLSAILFASLLSASAQSAVRTGGRSRNCIEFLDANNQEITSRTRMVLADDSQEAFNNNLREMGYPDHIVEGKNKSQRFKLDEKLKWLKEYLTQPDRDWATPITDEDYHHLSQYHSAQIILPELGYWDQIKGFNTVKFIKLCLKNYNDDETGKYLASWAHLWVHKPGGFKLLLQFLSNNEYLVDSPWMANYLTPQNQRLVHKKVRSYLLNEAPTEYSDDDGQIRALLKVFALLTNREIPAKADKALAIWADLKAYKPWRSNKVNLCSRGNVDAGTCPEMSSGHLRTLGLYTAPEWQEQFRHTALIFVNNHLVGALKLEGDASLLALRNVVAADGRLILALGAVYHVSKDLVEFAQKSVPAKPKSWVGLDVDELRVEPSTFLLNKSAWDSDYLAALVRATQNVFSKDEIIDIWKEPYVDNLKPDVRMRVWSNLIKSLDQLRRNLEQARVKHIDASQ